MAKKALIHQIEARERRGRWFGALAILISMSLLLSGWVGLFAFLGANSAYGTFEELQEEWVPDTRSMELALPDLSRVSRIYAESGEVLAELHDGRNSEPVPYDEIPEVMVHAMLAAEDSDFFEHSGVDFSAIASAAIDNLIYDTTRGGSTITQQVVKNAFVGAEVSIQRKINEAFVAAEVERRFPKERILEFYMNSVYFGSGAYGIKTAALEFYGKELDQLQIHEAAALAVLVRNPTLYNPRKRPEGTLERRDDVIRQMAEEGWITPAQAETALEQPLDVIDSPLRRGEADHVVAEVKRQLLNDPEFDFLGATSEERKRAIFGCPADDVACEGGGGLQVYTTIDLDLQKKANEILLNWLPLLPYEENIEACRDILPNESDDFLGVYAETHSCVPTGAMTMVDNDTGAVKVMASGLPFEFSQFDLAVQGRRNPGSSFKPFGLVAALEQGYTMGHHWSGQSPIDIQCPFPCAPNGSNIWRVHNAGASKGVIPLSAATYGSVNAVYAQLSLAVGPENVVEVAKRMGVDESALDPVLSIVLGSSAVSTKEMASAYTNFATNGLHAEDYIVSRIVNSEGEVIYEHDVERIQVSDPGVFAAARRALNVVPISGTGPRANLKNHLGYSVPQGGKTGTHQSYLDAWYVGYTAQYSTAVWVGYEAKQVPLENVLINGQNYSRVFGGSVPAPIWSEFMAYVHQDLEVMEFPAEPENIGRYLVPPATTVPAVVGLEQAEAEERLREAKLNATIDEIPSLEPAGIVVNQSHEPGASVSQGSFITIQVSTGETPEGALPSLIGLTVEQAIDAIRDFEAETGLKVSVFEERVETLDPKFVDKVINTNPEPGTILKGSAQVILYVGEAVPPEE